MYTVHMTSDSTPLNSEERLDEIDSRLSSIESRLNTLPKRTTHPDPVGQVAVVMGWTIVASVFIFSVALYNIADLYLSYLRALNGLKRK